jgi:arylsulfatase A
MKYHLKIFVLLLSLFYTTSCEKKEQLPNIVLIMADDMGYECLGCYGSTEYITPNLDRLAAEGIRFDHCYSQPLCTPSRVKIMTGQYNFRNYEDFGYLNPNQKTFANLLKDAGYATCIAGKWQLNGLNRNNPGNQDVNRPYHFGFDEYCLWQLHHRKNDGERFANALITQNGIDLPRTENSYGPQVFADYICDFIGRNAGKPFLVYYPMVLVHDPFVPTPDSPEWIDSARRYENDTAYFSDMVAYTDRIIGQLEAKLRETGVWDNTLFIFTGDNGTGRTVFSSTVSGVVQGGKGLTINTGSRVPLIVSWPAKMKGKRVSEAMVSFADFFPTLCEIAGINPELYANDGKSLAPVIFGEKEKIQDEIFIHYSPRWGNNGHNRWVMKQDYKLYRDGRFYNTATDPEEENPLTNFSEEEKMLKEHFQQILNEKENLVPFHKNDTSFNLNN